jgi:hypothetical protein
MLPFLAPVLFIFYIQGVLKFKCKTPVPKVNTCQKYYSLYGIFRHYHHRRNQGVCRFGPLVSFTMSLKLVQSRTFHAALNLELKAPRQRHTNFHWNQKVNFTLSKSWRHIGLCVQLRSFSTSTLDKGQQVSSHSSRLQQRTPVPLITLMGGSRSLSGRFGKKNSLAPYRD